LLIEYLKEFLGSGNYLYPGAWLLGEVYVYEVSGLLKPDRAFNFAGDREVI